MDLEFRKAYENEIDFITDFVDEAKVVMDAQGIFQWDEIYPTKEDFTCDWKNDSLYVGTNEGKIAVVFVLNRLYDDEYKTGNWEFPEKEYMVLHRLCVNPKFQNKGVGKAAMLYIEKLLKEQGIKAIRLDVFSQNPFSQKLYEKFGFKQTGIADWRKGRFYLMEKYI